MRLESPWMLLLLALIPALVAWRIFFQHGKRGAIRFSSTGDAARAHRSIRQYVSWFPAVLRMAALALLIFAIARPQKGLEEVKEITEGIAIEMVIDRSTSMKEEMRFRGRRMARLDVVKQVFGDFVLGGVGLEGRESDMIGIISFARYADTTCPLILGHETLPEFLKTIDFPDRPDEDGTAIGDAIALAAARLHWAEKDLAERNPDLEASDYRIKSKVMILLTDGEQNRGEKHPIEAAKMAKEWGIKIYTIGIGGNRPRNMLEAIVGRGGVDTKLLDAISKETGGKFYLADNADALTRVYQEIDELERTEIEVLKTLDHEEIYLPFALAGLACLVVEILLSSLVFRKIP